MQVSDKAAYLELAPERAGLFGQPWWWDTLCGPKGWDAVVVEHEGYGLLLPFHTKQKRFLRYITMPEVSLFGGPFCFYEHQPVDEIPAYHWEKMLEPVLEQWKRYAKVTYQFDPRFQSISAFQRAGYSLRARTHYELPAPIPNDPERGYRDNVRRQVRKASKNLTIQSATDLDQFLQLSKQTYTRQGVALPYSPERLEALWKHSQDAGCSRLLEGYQDDACIGALWMMWDHTYLYYFLSGMHPDAKQSGVMSLLLHESILEAQRRGLTFHFYGSEIPSIAQFFQRFGALARTSFLATRKLGLG